MYLIVIKKNFNAKIKFNFEYKEIIINSKSNKPIITEKLKIIPPSII